MNFSLANQETPQTLFHHCLNHHHQYFPAFYRYFALVPYVLQDLLPFNKKINLQYIHLYTFKLFTFSDINIGKIPRPMSNLLLNFIHLSFCCCFLLIISNNLCRLRSLFFNFFLEFFPLFFNGIFIFNITYLETKKIVK